MACKRAPKACEEFYQAEREARYKAQVFLRFGQYFEEEKII